MMFLVYLKSDLKRQLRDRTGWVMSVIFPLLLIFILSNAFGTLMNKTFELSPFSIGYSVTQKSPLSHSLSGLKKELTSYKITLVETTKADALKHISDNNLAGYIDFTDTGFQYYSNDNMNIDSSIFESVLQSISYSTGTYAESAKVLADYGAKPANSHASGQLGSLLTVNKLAAEPFPSALTYYGLVMLINILCYSAVGTVNMIHEDRQLGINRRIGLTRIGPLAVFWGRIISSTLMNLMQIGATMLMSTLLLGVNYGSQYPFVIALVLLFAVTANSVSIMLGYLVRNAAISRTLIYAISFFLNFFGGSYTQYLYASGRLLRMMQDTPLYYINRCLVEIATRGSSSMLPDALTIMLSSIVISLVIGGVAFSRMEGRLCNN